MDDRQREAEIQKHLFGDIAASPTTYSSCCLLVYPGGSWSPSEDPPTARSCLRRMPREGLG